VFTGLSISPLFYLGNIEIYSNGDISTVTQDGVKYQQYRYILIPGGTAARKVQIDWKNYKEVQKYLGLKD
jgi:putative intracellular protease/amidase